MNFTLNSLIKFHKNQQQNLLLINLKANLLSQYTICILQIIKTHARL